VVATFGRSFYVLDNYSALRELTSEALEKEAHLFSSRRTWWYLPADQLGGPKGSQGDSFFSADNPTYGAVFTVHLRDAFKSLKDTRKEAEESAKKENKDAVVPAWDDLDKENDQLVPIRYLQITNDADVFVARVELPKEKGIHRVAWDLKQAPLRGISVRPLALPGNYKAKVVEWDGKQSKTLSEPITFKLEAMMEPSLPRVDLNEALEFKKSAVALQLKLDRLQRKLDKAVEVLEEAEAAIKNGIAEPGELLAEARLLTLEVQGLKRSLFGNPIKTERYIETIPTPASRLSASQSGFRPSSHGPTKTQRQQFEIAKREIEATVPKVEQAAVQKVDNLRQKLEVLGIELTASVQK
jgi:hypothetical protein